MSKKYDAEGSDTETEEGEAKDVLEGRWCTIHQRTTRIVQQDGERLESDECLKRSMKGERVKLLRQKKKFP